MLWHGYWYWYSLILTVLAIKHKTFIWDKRENPDKTSYKSLLEVWSFLHLVLSWFYLDKTEKTDLSRRNRSLDYTNKPLWRSLWPPKTTIQAITSLSRAFGLQQGVQGQFPDNFGIWWVIHDTRLKYLGQKLYIVKLHNWLHGKLMDTDKTICEFSLGQKDAFWCYLVLSGHKIDKKADHGNRKTEIFYLSACPGWQLYKLSKNTFEKVFPCIFEEIWFYKGFYPVLSFIHRPWGFYRQH